MAFREAQLREERLRLKEAEIRAEEATFHPQLNPRSLNLAQDRLATGTSSSGVVAVAIDSEREAAQRRRREALATRDLKECTFVPNTAKPRVIGYYDEYAAPVPNAELSIAAAVKDGGGPDALLQRIDEYRNRKEQWAAQVRAEEERKQLAECTFAPRINKPRSPSSTTAAAPTVHETVAGMGRFLEMKAMAEKKQAEMQARAAKVFLLQPRSPKSRGGLTVAKPFKFASEARSQAARRASGVE